MVVVVVVAVVVVAGVVDEVAVLGHHCGSSLAASHTVPVIHL